MACQVYSCWTHLALGLVRDFMWLMLRAPPPAFGDREEPEKNRFSWYSYMEDSFGDAGEFLTTFGMR